MVDCYCVPDPGVGCPKVSALGLVSVHRVYFQRAVDRSGAVCYLACQVFREIYPPGGLEIPGALPPHLHLAQKTKNLWRR